MIIFIHGMWGNGLVFKLWLRLADKLGLAACALDLRGHGNSACPNHLGKVSLDEYIEDIRMVIDHIGECILIGHSMGALLARSVASFDRRVVKVVSVASAPEAAMFVPDKIAFRMLKSRYLRAMMIDSELIITDKDACELLGNALSDNEQAEMLRDIGPESGRAARDIISWVWVSPLLCPGFVVFGDKDKMTHPSIQILTARRNKSPIATIKGGCHMLQLQSGGVAEKAFAKIVDFIKK